MGRVCIHVSGRHDESHWQSPVAAVRQALSLQASAGLELVQDPADADLILVCGPMDRALSPMAAVRDPVIRSFRRKCVRFSCEDAEFHALPGIYTSLLQSRHAYRCYRGGVYPHVATCGPEAALPLDEGPSKYLYCFLGDFASHPVRRAVGLLDDPRGLVQDTGGHPGNKRGQSAAAYAEFANQYVEALRLSKFALCPRGRSPSSIRLFEAMKGRRVPVILSDEWVPPEGPDWTACSIRVRECDAGLIPGILKDAESRYAAMAIRARQEWERWFAVDRLGGTLLQWSQCILRESSGRVPVRVLARELCSGPVLRYGIGGAIRARLGTLSRPLSKG